MANGKYRKNFVALQKVDETFIVLYDDEDTAGAVRAIAGFAANPQLNFTWRDAAVLVGEMFPSAPPATDIGDLPIGPQSKPSSGS